MTRQELTDAVAEVLGMAPGREMKTETIVLLADRYAASFAESRMDALIRGVREDQP